MIALDTNILVYAHRVELSKHDAAKARLIQLAEGSEPWAIPVFCVGEFIRVVTHHRIFDPPHTVDEACAAVDHLLESPSLRIIRPGDRFESLLMQAIRSAEASGNLVFDAQIVAVCRETGIHRFLTEDRDFKRFQDFPLEHL